MKNNGTHYEENENKTPVAEEDQGIEKMTVSATEEWKKLQVARDYKTANNLFEQSRINEKEYIGDQYEGINTKRMRKTVYNFLGQTTDVKVSAILANEITVQRTANDIDMKDPLVKAAVEAFQHFDKVNWERLDMDTMNEDCVMDGAISNLGVSYWYWDEEIQRGNTHQTSGDFDGKLVNMVDFYVANPTQVDVQQQPWIKIVIRMTVKELREYAKTKGVSEEKIQMITADEDERAYAGFEKFRYEQDETNTNDSLASLVINLKKEDKKVIHSSTAQSVEIEDWNDIDKKLYPVAIFPYKKRKNFIYAEAEFTRYIENQKIANIQQAARHHHALLMAIPKLLWNKKMIGSFSSTIGSINPVDVPAGSNIANAMSFVQPTAMSGDVDKSIDESINRTQKLAGVNDNILGAAKAENAAALITQIKQASTPYDPYKRRYYKYVKDVMLIWEDFYKSEYSLIRVYEDPNEEVKEGEEKKAIQVTGTDYKDINIVTNIDIGPSTQWGEVTSLALLMQLWDKGIVTDPNDIISRLPDNSIKNQKELLDKQDMKEVFNMLMDQYIKTLPVELQQTMSQMDFEQKKEVILELSEGEQNLQV